MKYLTFGPSEKNMYPIAVLTKYLRRTELEDYVSTHRNDTVAYNIPIDKKIKKDAILAYLAQLLPVLCNLRVEYILVADANFFKVLAGVQQADRFSGYVLSCVLKDFEHLNIIYVPPASQIMYNPEATKPKLLAGLNALDTHRAGTYQAPGEHIIHFAEYPHSVEDIKKWLIQLIDVPLSIDIETYDLKHNKAGIGTITMCWDKHHGIAFAVDKDHTPTDAMRIRHMLRDFFEHRDARTLYHRSWFDVYVLVYQLFMKDVQDTEGLLTGLEHMLRKFEDTQLIRYLATNSCAGNKLSLKDAAQEFSGNYAVEVSDITKVPLADLLRYNLIDGLSTWYVWDKHYSQMVADQQLDIYENLFKPCMHDIIQMQLTGLPMDMDAVFEGEKKMQADQDAATAIVLASSFVAEINLHIARAWAIKRNQELKVKRVTEADCTETFNINSPPQIGVLLHEIMGLPMIETTDSGQPSTGMDAIEALIHHTTTPEQTKVLQALIGYKSVNKILTSFIPAFKAATLAPDGHYYLYGGFNLGGTLSGRLSSSDPNLQNLPANAVDPLTGQPSIYPKLVKKMFKAPKGKIFAGLDFASLEDKISALTTKDPNKLKVYTDGYDGHSLRAFFYFREQMPDIVETVASINSIKTKYGSFRQDSKSPTFALTYQGTWRTLVSNCGFSKVKAEMIEERYHEMYQVSDQWVQDKLTVAAQVGYVTVAFGLRLRTPMMKQTVMGLRATPYEAVAEGRTAGNALGQSYCMLNSRAAMAFMKKVRAHPVWRTRIRPCAQIHDAMYFIVDNDVDLIAWMNIHLVDEVRWQNLPEIQHPLVKLGGELSLFYPTWKDEFTIPNGADADQIYNLAKEYVANAKP